MHLHHKQNHQNKMDSRQCTTASELTRAMEARKNPEKSAHLMRFFKTGKNEYGEGDEFLGLTTPETRDFVRQSTQMSLVEVKKLLVSRWHEIRLCGFLILVAQFERACRKSVLNVDSFIVLRDHIAMFYLEHCEHANNWDLVDLSCYKIVGRWLTLPSSYPLAERQAMIDELAFSGNLWKERISMVSTMWPLREGDPSYTLKYAVVHLHHPHDLMHKAVGWLLREMGKRCGVDILREFLSAHASEMPRTALRYAIEHLDDEERQTWLRG